MQDFNSWLPSPALINDPLPPRVGLNPWSGGQISVGIWAKRAQPGERMLETKASGAGCREPCSSRFPAFFRPFSSRARGVPAIQAAAWQPAAASPREKVAQNRKNGNKYFPGLDLWVRLPVRAGISPGSGCPWIFGSPGGREMLNSKHWGGNCREEGS